MRPHILDRAYIAETDEVELTIQCPSCGNEKKLKVNPDKLHSWFNGMLVQNAFPDMSSSDREALITGTCDECWEMIFGDARWSTDEIINREA